MMIGDPNTFAIEWEVYHMADLAPHHTLGFFCMHVAGFRYGVKEPAATMLSAPIAEAESHLACRGEHVAPFARQDAFEIAAACRRSIYEDCPDDEIIFNFRIEALASLFQRELLWGPDVDEAFDDGSYILQFDVGDHVRLIAFQTNDAGEPIRTTLTDALIPADNFYDLLRRWLTTIKTELAGAGQIH